jgi:cell division protein FtsQ
MERRIARDLTSYLTQRPRATLGQQKALDSKKARPFRELVYLGFRITSAVVALLVVMVLVIRVRTYLLHSPRFGIAIKEIHGLRHVSESQILMKLKQIEERNQNLFAVNLDELRKSLELLPWVKDATVRRMLPDKLIIQVVERVPIAFARTDHTTCLVDDEGMLLETRPEQFWRFDFPVIFGLEPGFEPELLSRNKKRTALYKSFMKSLDGSDAGLSRDVSEVHLQDPQSISIVLNDDTVLVHLGPDQFQEKFRRYLAMSREIKQKYPQADSVDLRFENQIIINAANEKITSALSN